MRIFQCTVAVLLMVFSNLSIADDTEIYTSAGLAGSEPLVMFFIDYRPNLGSTVCSNVNVRCTPADYFRADPNTAGDLPTTGKLTLYHVLRLTLKQVFARTEGVKVGLMLNHNDSCSGNPTAGPDADRCSNGSYIPFGFRRLNAETRADFDTILAALPIPKNANNSHKNQGEEKAFELFRYLTGQGVFNGHNGYDDFGLTGSPNLDVDFRAASWDENIEEADATVPGGSRYITPLNAAAACGKIFLINLTFGVLNQNDDSDAAILAPKSAGGMDFPDDKTSVDYVETIQRLFKMDLADGTYGDIPNVPGTQNVTSYFISPRRSTLLEDLAFVGGSEKPYPLSDDPQELVETLENILSQILSVSSTFVPVSLPVNTFNRSEVVDNVFLALFEVQAEGRPGWAGNLKKLKLGAPDLTGQIELIDSLGSNAVAVDGRISNNALTFWTDPVTLPLADLETDEVNGRDGRFVARGGAGQKTPGFVSGSPGSANAPLARTLYYDSAPSTFANFNADTATASALQTALGANSTAEAQALIAHARGLDIDDLDGDGNRAEARPWLIGDPLHSRPNAINYGARAGHSETNPLIYVAMGTNDGFMHFIRNTNADGTQLGRETWGFIPREVMGIRKQLRDNTPSRNHPYGVDGVPVVFKGDNNSNGTIEPGEPVLLVFGLRRGGKAYYGLDVSDPENPNLRWTITKGGDFAELGLTFSSPRIAIVDSGTGPRHALIFGGGYDTNKDSRTGVGTDDTEGNALYVVDMDSGNLIWKAVFGGGGSSATVFQHPDFTDSIPSEVTIADTDGDGVTDRVLFGDTGGNVWRADLIGADSSDWQLTRLAMLGRHATGGKANDRRFFHRPDFVPSRDATGPFDAVILGSGDRADPKDMGGEADNYIFMIKDRHVAAGSGQESELYPLQFADVTDNCLQDNSCVTPPDLLHGWRIALERRGEKVLASPLTIAGTIYLTSFVPPQAPAGPPTACKLPEGDGYLYALSLQYGTATRNYNENDNPPGDPDSPNSRDDRDTQLLSSGIPAEVVPLPPDMILRPDLVIESTGTNVRWKTFWYEVENPDL